MKKINTQNWILFTIGLSFFFAVNHYRGIVIDGPLYLLQVIHSWFPERFVEDVSFMYGNQDSFSLFSPLYGLFIKFFEVSFGSKILCLLLQLVWASSMILFIKGMAHRYIKRDVALPLVLLYFGFYASGMPNTQQNFLFLIDGYAVARLAAVSFAIAGLAFLICQRKYSALGFFLLGSSMHPLMAGWCLVIWMFLYYPRFNKIIITVSLFLPLTIFVGKGVLAQYPEGWLNKPLYFAPSIGDLVRFIGYIMFFVIAAKNSSAELKWKKVSRSVAIVVSIALYWWCWAGFGQHILLYQVQTFRVEWICLVCALPFYVALGFERYEAFRQNGFLSTYDLALLCLGLNLFLPGHSISALVAGVILAVRKESRLTELCFQWMLMFCSVLTLLYQSYLNFYMLGAKVPLIRSFLDASKIAESLVLSNVVLGTFAAIYLIKTKKLVLGLLFAVYCIFPALQLLSIAACFVWMRQLESNKKILVAVTLIALVEGLSSLGERILFIPLPKAFLNVFVMWLLFAACCLVKNHLKNRVYISKVPIIAFLAVTFAYAGNCWDERSEDQKTSERQMDVFVDHPLFPQVKNQGKVLYYVEGFNEAFPRAQFLNGGYFDENSLIGGMFLEKQYDEGNRRRNLLYKGFDDGTKSDNALYRNFVGTIFSNRDSLIAKLNLLCEKKEIDYLISSQKNVPLVILDSLHLNVLKQDVFLFSCR